MCWSIRQNSRKQRFNSRARPSSKQIIDPKKLELQTILNITKYGHLQYSSYNQVRKMKFHFICITILISYEKNQVSHNVGARIFTPRQPLLTPKSKFEASWSFLSCNRFFKSSLSRTDRQFQPWYEQTQLIHLRIQCSGVWSQAWSMFNSWCCSNCYITIKILDLEYVEIDTEIFPIAQIQMEMWKATKNSAWPWIWRSTVDFAVIVILLLRFLTLNM